MRRFSPYFTRALAATSLTPNAGDRAHDPDGSPRGVGGVRPRPPRAALAVLLGQFQLLLDCADGGWRAGAGTPGRALRRPPRARGDRGRPARRPRHPRGRRMGLARGLDAGRPRHLRARPPEVGDPPRRGRPRPPGTAGDGGRSPPAAGRWRLRQGWRLVPSSAPSTGSKPRCSRLRLPSSISSRTTCSEAASSCRPPRLRRRCGRRQRHFDPRLGSAARRGTRGEATNLNA